jgi:hypothetical protein
LKQRSALANFDGFAVEMIGTAKHSSMELLNCKLTNKYYKQKSLVIGQKINYKRMKKIFYILVCAALIVAGGMFLQSCENNNGVLEDMSRGNKEKEAFFPLVISQTTLENNQYVFHLTLDEAIRNGMSREMFFEFQRQIQQVNEDIQEALNNPEIDEVFIDDPQAAATESYSPRLKSGIEHPSGGGQKTTFAWFSVPTGGAWTLLSTIRVPSDVSQIYVTATTACLLLSVTVEINGSSKHFTGFVSSTQGPFSVSSSFSTRAWTQCSNGATVRFLCIIQ